MTTNERFKFQSLGCYAASLVTLLLLAALLGVGWVYQKAAFENQLAALNQQIAKLDENLSNQIAKLDDNLSNKLVKLDDNLSKQIATVDEKHTQAIAELSKAHDNLSNQIAAVDGKQTQSAAELSKAHDNLSNQIAAVDEKQTQSATELSKVHDNLSNQIAVVDEKHRQVDDNLSNEIAAIDNKHTQAIAELSKTDENLSNQIAGVDENLSEVDNKHVQAAAKLSKLHDNLSTQIAAVDEKHSQAIAQLVASKKVHEPDSKSDDSTVFQDRLKDGSLGPKMVMIPSGTFRMGDIQGGGRSNEQPVHSVHVDSFAMGVYEVTVAQFRQFVNATGYQTDAEKKGSCYSYANGRKWVNGANWRNPGFSQDDTHPVVCVSFHDAKAYTDWLSEQTGHQYRLPTEAEWEYAARAGTITKYWWGNNIGSNRANCNSNCGDSYQYTAPVGSFAANPFGLYDTVGNTWEWTCSQYESSYSGKEQRCADNAGRFVRHGGSWLNDATRTRSAARYWNDPAGRIDSDGFRLARIK
jgi:formylglycine-generating enzyme required for sulfatase activity